MLNLIILAGLGIMAVVMFFFYRQFSQETGEGQDKNKNGNLSPEGKVAKAQSSQDFLIFENIEDNLLKLDNRRYRAYIKVEPINWALKTFDEQDLLQTQFMQIMNGLRYPILIYIPRIRTNIDKNMKVIEEHTESYNIQELKDFGEELIKETRRWVAVNSPMSHGFFIIVFFDEIQNIKGYSESVIKKQALLELQTRCDTLIEALGRSGLEAYRVEDASIAQLLNFNMNRDLGAIYSISEAIEKGVFNISVTSYMERKKEPMIAREIYDTELPFDEEVV